MSKQSVDEILTYYYESDIACSKENLVRAKQYLLSLIEEKLPSEVVEPIGDGRSYSGRSTWNDCLDEVKSILREMFK